MRVVDRPAFKPHHCAAIPHMGQTKDTRWIDTGAEMAGFDNHIYISEVAVNEMARLLGAPTAKEYGRLVTELQTVYKDLANALDQVAALSKYEAAVEEIRQTATAAA
jgi:hypothetical protein